MNVSTHGEGLDDDRLETDVAARPVGLLQVLDERLSEGQEVRAQQMAHQALVVLAGRAHHLGQVHKDLHRLRPAPHVVLLRRKKFCFLLQPSDSI